MRIKRSFVVCILLISIFMTGCSGNSVKTDLWEDAIYTEDTELGNGVSAIFFEVRAENKSVTFKINTDKTTVGDALAEHNLISGEMGAYGLYVKVVNGITADYDKDKSFWSFCKNGKQLQTGVDQTELENGEHYELIYTK